MTKKNIFVLSLTVKFAIPRVLLSREWGRGQRSQVSVSPLSICVHRRSPVWSTRATVDKSKDELPYRESMIVLLQQPAAAAVLRTRDAYALLKVEGYPSLLSRYLRWDAETLHGLRVSGYLVCIHSEQKRKHKEKEDHAGGNSKVSRSKKEREREREDFGLTKEVSLSQEDLLQTGPLYLLRIIIYRLIKLL